MEFPSLQAVCFTAAGLSFSHILKSSAPWVTWKASILAQQDSKGCLAAYLFLENPSEFSMGQFLGCTQNLGLLGRV